MALIHKIDPSKPFGQFTVQIRAKRIRQAFNNIGRSYGNLDMQNQNHYRDVVNQINNSNFMQKRQGGGVGFFVTNNPGVSLPPSNEIQRRRNGLNLGDIQGGNDNTDEIEMNNLSAEGEVAEDEDGQKSFGSNVCNTEF